MRNNRKGLIIVISIIVIIVVILSALGIIYFATDLLKSNQELFFKYLAKNVDIIETYTQEPDSKTIEDIKQNKHTTKTNIGFDLVSSDTSIANQTIPPRNFTIEYAGQADPQNNMNSSQSTIKFLTKDLFTLKYAHNQDLYALTSEEVLQGGLYLAVDNNNLKNLASKMGITDVSTIPNKIKPFELSDFMSFSEQNKKHIQDTYIEVINSEIPKDKYYSKKNVVIQNDSKDVKTNCYELKLTSAEYKKVIIAILNRLKQDDTTLNLILQKISIVDSETSTTLQDLKTSIDDKINQITNNQTIGGIVISVYEKEGNLVRTQIEKENEDKYIFDFVQTSNAIRTIISYEYNYSQKNNPTTILENTNNIIDQEYMQIEGNTNTVQTNQSTQAISKSTKIKQIEIAKQIEGTQSNSIIIFTLETGNDKIVKLSLQSKISSNSQAREINSNTIININDSDITYFTIKANTTTNSSNDVVVEQLNDQNSAIVNNFNEGYIKKLVTDIYARLEKLYEEKMQIATTVQQEENASQGLNNTNTNTNITGVNEITSNNSNTTL